LIPFWGCGRWNPKFHLVSAKKVVFLELAIFAPRC
jgi:hypothetical protein